MKLDFVNQDDISVCFPEGSLDHAQSMAAENKLAAMAKEGVSKIIFDLSRVDYLSSRGMRRLIRLIKRANENNGKVVFCAPSSSVSNLIELTAFQNDLEVYPTLFDALLSLETGR